MTSLGGGGGGGGGFWEVGRGKEGKGVGGWVVVMVGYGTS